MKLDYGNPLLPKKRQSEKTDHAKSLLEDGDALLSDLDAILADSPMVRRSLKNL